LWIRALVGTLAQPMSSKLGPHHSTYSPVDYHQIKHLQIAYTAGYKRGLLLLMALNQQHFACTAHGAA